MTREEYADHMRRLTAGGGDDPVGPGSPPGREVAIQGERAQAGTAAPASSDAPGDPVAERDGGPGRDAPVGQREPPAASSEVRAGEHPEAADIAELRAQLAQTRAELAQAKGERDQARSERDQKDTELAQTRAELAQTKGELDETKGELDQAKSELKQANEKIASLEANGHPDAVPGQDAEESRPGRTDADGSDPRAEDSDTSSDQEKESPSIDRRTGTERAAEARYAGLAERPRSRYIVTSDHVAVAATLIDAYDTVSKFAAHVPLDGLTPLAGTAAGVLALAMGRFEKHNKEKKE
jgi:hypothetical protein